MAVELMSELIWSPIYALAISLALLAYENRRRRIDLLTYLSYLVVGGLFGILTALAIVALQTVIHSSPQGPLLLIFYGRVGLAVGMALGTIRWMVKVRSATSNEGW